MRRVVLVWALVLLALTSAYGGSQSESQGILRPCFYTDAFKAGHVVKASDVFVRPMDLRPYEPTVAQRAAEQFITDRVMPLLLGRRLKHAVTPGENVKLKDFEESSLGRNGFRVL